MGRLGRGVCLPLPRGGTGLGSREHLRRTVWGGRRGNVRAPSTIPQAGGRGAGAGAGRLGMDPRPAVTGAGPPAGVSEDDARGGAGRGGVAERPRV